MSKALLSNSTATGALLLLAWLCISPMTMVTAFAQDREQSQAELKALQAKIRKAQSRLLLKQGARKSEVNALNDIQGKLNTVQRDINASNRAIARQHRKLGELQDKQNLLRKQQAQQQEAIAEHLDRAYRLSRQSRLKLLLNQEDPAKVSRMLGLYQYVNREHQQQIEEYLATIEELETLKPAIAAEAESLKKGQQTLRKQQVEFSSQKDKRKATLARIDRDIRKQGKTIKNLEAEQAALEDLLKTLQENLAEMELPDSFQPFPKMKGKLDWPSKGRHAVNYGEKRGETGLRWKGVKINGGSGKGVRAVHHGRVVFADWLRGAGMLIIIDHGDGYFTLYSQNQSLSRELGDWVQPGEIIAEIGDQDGGLYFEMRRERTPFNPNPWFKRG